MFSPNSTVILIGIVLFIILFEKQVILQLGFSTQHISLCV